MGSDFHDAGVPVCRQDSCFYLFQQVAVPVELYFGWVVYGGSDSVDGVHTVCEDLVVALL